MDTDKKVVAIPFIIEDHLDTLEAVKVFLMNFADNDTTLEEMKAAIDIADKAKVFRDMEGEK